MIFKKVVFPQPLSPAIPIIPVEGALKDAPSKRILFVLYVKFFLITHNQQVDPIIEIIFTHKSQEN